jgi:hypothetical protein
MPSATHNTPYTHAQTHSLVRTLRSQIHPPVYTYKYVSLQGQKLRNNASIGDTTKSSAPSHSLEAAMEELNAVSEAAYVAKYVHLTSYYAQWKIRGNCEQRVYSFTQHQNMGWLFFALDMS